MTYDAGNLLKFEEVERVAGACVIKIPTEIYSRVVGYFRPVQNWNRGKQTEFSERAYYSLEKFRKKNEEERGKIS